MRFALTAAVSVIALAACSPEAEEAETEMAEAGSEAMEAAQDAGDAMEGGVDEAMAEGEAMAEDAELAAENTMSEDGQPASWGYDGEQAPENWGSLGAEYATCDTGLEQSPIDLVSTDMDAQNTPEINWTPVGSATVADTGKTIQVNVEDAGGLTLNGTEYSLIQFHFHAGSEHTIDGEQYPLEVHFVHASEAGELAVVGMMFEDGAANDPLSGIWASLPDGVGETDLDVALDPNAFLPEDGAVWRYEGSLTTPPCSEGVAWTVFQTPLSAAGEQIEDFTARYDNNYRPPQPMNERDLREGEAAE
ncbi:MAG: carbonic anhydrase family protein [Oceanicaulis sp.]